MFNLQLFKHIFKNPSYQLCSIIRHQDFGYTEAVDHILEKKLFSISFCYGYKCFSFDLLGIESMVTMKYLMFPSVVRSESSMSIPHMAKGIEDRIEVSSAGYCFSTGPCI